jgi:excinuclease ABC subunit A
MSEINNKDIIVKGAKMHNLKNVNVSFPRNKLTVITGLSGSGKSSLAFDTLYAEGQRRYVESLSSYARQFLGKLEKPNVDQIINISPAIAIEQKVTTRNSRSTVGTGTEIYDYLKLLFARVGKTYSPISGLEVKKDTPESIVKQIMSLEENTKVLLFAPVILLNEKDLALKLNLLIQQGFTRISVNGDLIRIEENSHTKIKKSDELLLLIDRFTIKNDEEETSNRIADSVETAFFEGKGECFVKIISSDSSEKILHYNNRFEADGMEFSEPDVNFFSFNNPIGACKTCEGFGSVLGIDEDLVVPNKNLSVYEDAIACWKGEKMKEWKDFFILRAVKHDFPVHRPYEDLTEKQKEFLWKGTKDVSGIDEFFKHLEEQSYKIQYRVMLSRYRGKTTCPDCKGTRLRKDTDYVKINGLSIIDLVLLPADNLLETIKNLNLNDYDKKIGERLLGEISKRLEFLCDVGLGYLTLNRLSNTLSGGESQRINLAKSLGSSLVGSMYILDEPSIGLHPRDTDRLIKVLKRLRDIGNTVIVVEHDEEIMKAADYIVDMGPMAGTHGGEVVFTGNHAELKLEKKSITAQYLNLEMMIAMPEKRRIPKYFIEIKNARENNLKGINLKLPLNCLSLITGVSGSGKSSLIKKIVYPGIKRILGGYGEISGKVGSIEGDIKKISNIEFIDQNPIGKSSRSNPATYIKAYDEIRNLFANQKASKINSYKPAHFSFNVPGGRCETCQGEGSIKVEMQFMADINLICEDCGGKQFKEEILEVNFKEKNIYDILNTTIDDAIDFFKTNGETKIADKLKPLQDVGLGYLKLGQSSNTLSGGEAQRIKLASFLSLGAKAEPVLFIFDEPTTGLHFHDIQLLLKAFQSLIEQGHSITVIEHNIDVIKCADYVTELGPEGGINGGNLLFQGSPEELINSKDSYTAVFLKEKMESELEKVKV